MNEPFLTLLLADEAQTLDLGARLAPFLCRGDFIALTGPLGAGKTTLARGLIRAFVSDNIDVPSPTFTLVQGYSQSPVLEDPLQVTQNSLDLYHFDLYRLNNPDEVWELGWEDMASAVALVEWPDKAGEYLPQNRLDILLLRHEDGRLAQFSAHANSTWKDRLHGV